MNLKFIVGAVGVALGVAVLHGCGASGASEPAKPAEAKDKPPAAEKAPKRAYPVRVASVITRSVQYELKAVGTVEADDTYQIDARVPGTLYDVNFQEGDVVKPDQVICKIAPEAYRQAMLKAKALYDQAVAEHANFKRKSANDIERNKIKLSEATLEIARRKAVKEAGAISDEEIQLYQSRRDLAALEVKDSAEAAETELRVLEATIEQRQAELKIAEEDVRKSIVMPPVPGVIEKKMVTSGMFANSGMHLAKIVDTRTLKLIFKVSEKDSAAVKEGEKVSFQVPAWPSRSFEAEIYFIGKQLETDSRVVTCFARVSKDLEKLKPGYFAAVRIITGARERAPVAPATAILPSEKGFIAFVVKDDKAELRYVKLGLTLTDNEYEILSGLNEGEMLVVEGANALQPSVPVRVIKPESKGALEKESAGSAQPLSTKSNAETAK